MRVVPDVITVAFQPWADLYSGSSLVSTGVEFLHLSSLLVAGGFALAYDRSALRAGRRPVVERTSFLRELRAVHRPVTVALALVVASGLALMMADVQAMLPSGVFWLKMGAFTLLLMNGLSVQRAGARLAANASDLRGWRALRAGSLRSITLWIVTVFLGVLLTSTA
jgi:hypothetical protein